MWLGKLEERASWFLSVFVSCDCCHKEAHLFSPVCRDLRCGKGITPSEGSRSISTRPLSLLLEGSCWECIPLHTAEFCCLGLRDQIFLFLRGNCWISAHTVPALPHPNQCPLEQPFHSKVKSAKVLRVRASTYVFFFFRGHKSTHGAFQCCHLIDQGDKKV